MIRNLTEVEMGRGLEARVERLEAAQGKTYGLETGRELARICCYRGEEAEAKARVFAGLPFRTHEEWLDIMKDPDLTHCLAQGPEKDLVIMRIRRGCGADYLRDDTLVLLEKDWLAFLARDDELMAKARLERGNGH